MNCPKTDGMEVNLRPEKVADYEAVFKLIEEAFKTEQFSDGKEQFLVNRLRKSRVFIPELSIVAEFRGEIVGHILLSRIKIRNEKKTFDSLALAPVSVKPKFQNKGIGGQLIEESHSIAKTLGYQSIVLLGHKNYYPRFGYELCSKYGIKIPFEAPDENCMAIELVENGLNGINGIVQYANAFFE